ncbi:aspartate aminotransferase family protein [Bradyrhizobium sp. RDM12]
MTSALKQAADEFLVRYGGDVFPNLFTSAKGTIVTDSNGRDYLDFTSGQMCATIGHNHPAIVAAVERAGKKAFHLFSGMIPEVVAELAQVLATDWLPGDLKRSIFINTGSEATEVALGWPRCTPVATRCSSLAAHGTASPAERPRSLWPATAKDMASRRQACSSFPSRMPIGPTSQKDSEDESALANLELALKMFDMQSSGRGAAIIAEPVISAGGVLVPPKAFMEALRKAADERGMLLIFDEAQTAFGRIGKKTGSEYFGVVPDIMTMSKTLGGGLPLAAVSTTEAIESKLHDDHFTYYTSHVSDPLLAEAGLAVLRVITEEKLVARANEMGAYLRGRFERLQQKYEQIGDIRGMGLLLGIELVGDRNSRRPAHQLGGLTTKKCFEYGLSMNIRRRPERGSVWRIAPPLTVSTEEIDRAVEILDRALRESLDELSRNPTA